MVSLNIRKRIRTNRSLRNTIHLNVNNVITSIRRYRESLTTTIINSSRTRTNSAMSTLSNSDCILINRESRTDSVSISNASELVRGNRADRDAVHQDIRYVIVQVRSDGEGLVTAIVDADRSNRTDRAARTRRSSDSELCDRNRNSIGSSRSNRSTGAVSHLASN